MNSPIPTLVSSLQNILNIVSKNQIYPKRLGIIHDLDIQKNKQQVLKVLFFKEIQKKC